MLAKVLLDSASGISNATLNLVAKVLGVMCDFVDLLACLGSIGSEGRGEVIEGLSSLRLEVGAKGGSVGGGLFSFVGDAVHDFLGVFSWATGRLWRSVFGFAVAVRMGQRSRSQKSCSRRVIVSSLIVIGPDLRATRDSV